MSLVLFLARSSRALLVSALLASIINGIVVSSVVSLMNDALNAQGEALRRIGLKFAALSVLMLVVRWVALAQFVRLSQTVLARLRMHVSRHVAEAAYVEIEAKGQGRLLAVLTEDISAVGDGFMLLPWLLVHGVILLGCLGHLAILSWQAFLIALGIVLLGSLGYARGVRLAHRHTERAREGEDGLFESFRALFAGAKELRLHDPRREAFLVALEERAEVVRKERVSGLRIHALLANWRLLLVFVLMGCAVFGLGAAFGVEGAVRSGYALTLLYMILPVNALFEAAPSLSRMQVALGRIQELGIAVDSEGVTPEAHTPTSPVSSIRRVSLVGAMHRYRGEDGEQMFELGPITLELCAGEVVFIVGGNGSGKTTLAKLLVGLYEPEAGQVLLDGKAVSSAGREAYRQHFSAIFSDYYLFDRLTVNDGRLDQRARELLLALDLEHKVTVKDGKFSTTALSSGQQRRLALLLSWLEDRPVYVFDEWAADQDPTYKEVFYRELLPALRARGKLVLVVTHDDRYFSIADRCLKLESGKLVESLAWLETPGTVPAHDRLRAPREQLWTGTGDA